MYKYVYSLVYHSVSPNDVGDSAHASSSSRGFLGFDFFSLAHPLVRTLVDCPGTVSWGNLDMQLQSPVDSRYDLGNCLPRFSFLNATISQPTLLLLQMQRILKVIMPLRGSST